MNEYDESVLVGKEPCPSCGSGDNLARYSDGHAFCFGQGCGHYEPADGEDHSTETPRKGKRMSDLINGEVSALSKRGISEETARKFGYKVGSFKGQPVHIAEYRDSDGTVIGQKLRFREKDAGMPWIGSNKGAVLFGAHLWGKGKRIVITEGEIDAMTVSQIQGNKWPVVSLINGASSAKRDLAKQIEYLSAFDEIVLCFDMDEPGRQAAREAAEVLPSGKVRIAALSMKDANECFLNGKTEEIVPAIWNAKPYRPDSVVAGSDIIERMNNRPEVVSLAYPDWMPIMNGKVLGIRLGELDTWTSGSGMGKTTVIKQLQHHFWNTTSHNQAILHLEEPLEDTADSLVGIHMQKRLELPEVAATVTHEEKMKAAEELFLSTDEQGDYRLVLHDAFGSMEDDALFNKIRYFAQGCGCKIIWLDHLSILVSDMGNDGGDERKRIDSIMHNLKDLTIELGIYIGLITHLRKTGGSGPSFEQGAVPSLDDLRGSGSIKQLSNSVYALSRNQQDERDVVRNTSQLHSLKCRRTGETGPADFITFNKETGCMEQGTDPSLVNDFVDETDEFSEGSGTQDF